MIRSSIRFILPALALFFAAGQAHATEPLPPPQGRIVLVVSGAISARNQGASAAFDMAMLERMPAVSITTTTIWTEGEQVFTGVPLAALLDRLGAAGKAIEASALNDYVIEIPVEDLQEDGPVLAYAQNGAVLSVRDKGPLWIVYPYDSDDRWRSEVIYARSVWQLTSITVLP